MSTAATSPTYRAFTRTANRVLPFLGRFSAKLAAGDHERRAALARWQDWAQASRDRERPLLWCHAASVGEGRQAEAVLRLVRNRHPDWQIVYTFYSPSAAGMARSLDVDRADYLPYDTTRAVDAMLTALCPTALVFAKLDVWPELAVRASSRGVAVGLLAGTVSPISRRLVWPARTLTRAGYAVLDRVAAVSSEDAARLETLGVERNRITVAGDPAFDSAVRRAGVGGLDDPLVALGAGAPTIVAGSTWEPDEEVMLRAFAQIWAQRPTVRLILVPHEPTPDHVRTTLRRANRAEGPQPQLLSVSSRPGPLVVVDRVGALATIYRAGTMALVGGGFGRSGLHSVVEPAAVGLPIVFGPRWQSSRAAGLLLAARAAVALPRRPAAAIEALAAICLRWIDDRAAREQAGAAARATVEAELGADARNLDVVDDLMRSRTVQRPTTVPS